jgi:DNA repair protein RecO (recombination protein O)
VHADAGVVSAPAGDATAIAGSDLLALQAALDAGDLGAVRRACNAPAAALRRVLRELLAYHLGATPLRTRQVLMDLQPLMST